MHLEVSRPSSFLKSIVSTAIILVAASTSASTEGTVDPRESAKARFTDPAARPFIDAIHVASARETLRVRLLSMPHAKQAPSMASAGHNPEKRASPGQLRTVAPATQ